MKKLDPKPYRGHVFVCEGKDCAKHGARDLSKALRHELRARDADCRISRTACLGQCAKRCVVGFEGPGGRWWGGARPGDAPKLAKKIAKRLTRGS